MGSGEVARKREGAGDGAKTESYLSRRARQSAGVQIRCKWPAGVLLDPLAGKIDVAAGNHLERKSSDSALPDLSDSAVRAKLRPIIITIAFLMFFVSAAGVFLTLPLGKSGRVDFRHLYTAGYMVRVGHAQDVYDYSLY